MCLMCARIFYSLQFFDLTVLFFFSNSLIGIALLFLCANLSPSVVNSLMTKKKYHLTICQISLIGIAFKLFRLGVV